jgi:methylglutaconyl-CoA hydratase
MRHAMETSVLIIEPQDEATVILTLNRPERRNALSIELMQSLCRTLETLSAEPGRRVVILRGAGPAFCAGLDLYEAAEPELAETSADWVARTFEALATSPLVTIAAAHGAAFAGGAGLLACCDFVIAADDLQIAFPEVRRGLVAALAAVALQTRLRASDLRELLLLAEPIDAMRAQRLGLVDRVTPADRMLAEAQQLAATLLKGAPEAVRQTKRLLREVSPTNPARLFQQALEVHKHARTSSEATEGLAAFRERRERKAVSGNTEYRIQNTEEEVDAARWPPEP